MNAPRAAAERMPGTGTGGSSAGGADPGRGTGWMVGIGQLLLTVLVTWFILRSVGFGVDELGELDPARWIPSPLPFVASCLVLLSGYVLSGVLWGRMARELGGPRLRLRTSVRTYFVANLGRYVPGKIWQITGLALLARRKGVPASVATAAAVLGQMVSIAAAALLGAAAFLGGEGGVREAGVWSLVGLLVALTLASVPPVFRRLVDLWFRVSRAEPPQRRPRAPGFVLRWLALYFANWLVYVAAFWLLVRSFGLPGSPLEVAPAFAAAYVLGYVAFFSPAGLGVREGFLTLFLAPVTGAAAAGAVAILTRLWTTGVEVVPAFAFWLGHVGRDRAEGGDEEGVAEAFTPEAGRGDG